MVSRLTLLQWCAGYCDITSGCGNRCKRAYLWPHPSVMLGGGQSWNGLETLLLVLIYSLNTEENLQIMLWTHWGCCVCTEDRCAAAAARGRHNLCGTHEDTAAPADTEATTTQDSLYPHCRITCCVHSLYVSAMILNLKIWQKAERPIQEQNIHVWVFSTWYHHQSTCLPDDKSKSGGVGVLADLVVVERLQTDGTVVCLYRLGRVAPRFGLTIRFGLQGRHSLQDILFRKQLKNTTQQSVTWHFIEMMKLLSSFNHFKTSPFILNKDCVHSVQLICLFQHFTEATQLQRVTYFVQPEILNISTFGNCWILV